MTDLEHRLRRIVAVVALLAIAGGITGMLPGHRVVMRSMEWVTIPAGGQPLLFMLAATLLWGLLLTLHPRRGLAYAWAIWTAIWLATFLGMTWGDQMFAPPDPLWAATATHVLVGAVLVLVFPVTWLVTLASRRVAPSDAPAARLIRR